MSTLTRNKSNTVGYDGISLNTMLLLLDFFTDALLDVLNLSIQQNVFPDAWNKRMIVPFLQVVRHGQGVATGEPEGFNSFPK